VTVVLEADRPVFVEAEEAVPVLSGSN
jgi:hypothetical protein